jgi:peptidoglycan/xylan/chitin deacetylase (PgdA/CDA1 family)
MNPLIRKLVLDPASKLFAPVYSGMGTIIYLDQIIPESRMSKIASNRSIEITPDFFEDILQFFIRRNYQAISLDELHAALNGDLKLDRKFVCYTFDDGYLSNYTTARQIFAKYEIPFAVNVCTSFIDGTGLLWWYCLEDLLFNCKSVRFQMDGTERELSCADTSSRERAFDTLTDIIRGLGMDRRDKFIRDLCDAHGIDPEERARRECLRWEHVREMANDPLITIGAHTVNHHNFTCLSDEEILREAAESKRIITEKTNQPVEHFAYPFGNRNAVGTREGAAAAKAGFKTMTTTRKANIFPGHRKHLEALPRIMLSGNYATLSRLERYRTGAIPAKTYGFRRTVTYE